MRESSGGKILLILKKQVVVLPTVGKYPRYQIFLTKQLHCVQVQHIYCIQAIQLTEEGKQEINSWGN